jgi:nitrate reductase gamma subunit
MHGLYTFVTGPLAWLAFIVFIGGSLYRVVSMLMLVSRKEKFIFSYMSVRYSLRSILHWMTPFATVNMRRHPAMTVVTFAFHFCLLFTPIFLLSHVVLWEKAWNVRWWTLPDAVADIMALVVVAGCVFFLGRRLVRSEVRFLTTASDYLILAMVALPFVSGFLAYHQWFAYRFFFILHVVSGEIMLMAIPFTRLSHMLFAPFVRAYTGSEFGKIRHARDW